MKFLCVSILFLCTVGTLFAQDKKLDSLINISNNYPKEDSQKIVYLNNIIKQYAKQNDMDNVEVYGKKAIAIAQKLPNSFSLSRMYNRLGLTYHGKSKYLQAIDYYNKGMEVAKQSNDKDFEANFYVNLSALYNSLPDYAKALECSQAAVSIYNAFGDKENISNCYMNIGQLYIDTKTPLLAINYIEKALPTFIAQNNGVNYGAASAYKSLANAYQIATDDELASININPKNRFAIILNNLTKSLKIAEVIQGVNDIEGPVNNDIGQLYENNGNANLALQYYLKGLDVNQKATYKENIAASFYSLGNFYINNYDVEKSKNYLHQSLQIGIETGLLSTQRNALEKLSVLYQKANSYDSALLYFKQFIVVKENIINQEKEKEITRKQLKLNFDIKENDYKLVQQITDGKLRQQVLFAKQQQQALTLKQQQLQLTNNEKDLQRLTFLKTQAELQNQQQIQSSAMQKNTIQAKYDKQIRDKQIAAQNNQITFDKKIKLYLGIAIGLGFLVTGFVFYSQRKTAKLNKIISEQKTTLEQMGHVKDKLFSVVSHDMRAPVNSLISFINILDNGNIPQQKLALYATDLKQNLTYTSSLMNNLLNWAASQMQGFKAVNEKVEVALLVNEVAATLQHHILQKNVQLQNNIDNDIVLIADKNMLAAICRNVISNATKYSFANGTIIIAAQQAINQLHITIQDEGTGMSAEKLQLFNDAAQQQMDSKRGTANEKGTGLGLMLCKTFAEQMGGKIIAEQNKEKGMKFTISLPNNTGLST